MAKNSKIKVPQSVAAGVPDRMFVAGSNESQAGRSIIGLTLAEIVMGCLSGSEISAEGILTAKGIPWVAYYVPIEPVIKGFELTKRPKG